LAIRGRGRGRGILGQPPIAGVIDADDDQPLDLAGADGGVSVLPDLPGAAEDERGARIEEVLGFLQVMDRVGGLGMLIVAGQDADDEVALVRQIMAGECRMETETWVRRGCPVGPEGGKQAFAQVWSLALRRLVFQIQAVLYRLSARRGEAARKKQNPGQLQYQEIDGSPIDSGDLLGDGVIGVPRGLSPGNCANAAR
jgi:hypothetical protein